MPGISGRPAATVIDGNMFFTFSRDDASETSDVTLTVEAGNNLLTWPTVFHVGPDNAASSPGVSIIENGADPDSVRVAVPLNNVQTKFARLKVTITP